MSDFYGDETAYTSYGGYEMEEEEYFEEEEYLEEEEQVMMDPPAHLTTPASPRSQNERAAYAASLAKELYGSGGMATVPASPDPPVSSHEDALKAALLLKRREYNESYNMPSLTEDVTHSGSGGMMMSKNANRSKRGGSGGRAAAGSLSGIGGIANSQNDETASTMFNYDDEGDAPPPDDTAEDELTWRLDPIKSLSDWTITVTNRETSECKTYHVHRNVLAIGKRKAEYFVRYFQSHDRLASSKTGTEIWLEKVAAKTIPELLDYMYSTEGKLDISTQSAIGLRHLAQFFGIRPLHQKVMEFILEDMNMSNIDVYYRDSVSVDDDKVAEMAAAKCAENILQIKITKPGAGSLLNNVDAHFFRRIMSSPAIDSKPKHYHISALLAEFLLANKQHIDEQDFERLTDGRYLKHVQHQAALTLLEVEADLGLSVADEDKTDVTTALQKRCISDLTDHWDDVSKMKQENVLRVLRKLPSTVVAELFVKSLAQARKAVNENTNTSNKKSVTIVAPGGQGPGSKAPNNGGARKTVRQGKGPQSNSNGRVASNTDGKDAAAVREEYDAKIVAMRRAHDNALEKLKREFEVSLLKLRDMVLEKDQDITKYAKELKKFQRLPNAHGGKLVSSNDKNKPVSMPTSLPGSRAQSPEGVIYAKMNGGGRFPLFYYNPSISDERKSSKSSSSAVGTAATGKQLKEI